MKLKSEVSPAQVLAQMYEMLRMIERGEIGIDSMSVESSFTDESAVTVSLRLRGPQRLDVSTWGAMQAKAYSIPPPPNVPEWANVSAPQPHPMECECARCWYGPYLLPREWKDYPAEALSLGKPERSANQLGLTREQFLKRVDAEIANVQAAIAAESGPPESPKVPPQKRELIFD